MVLGFKATPPPELFLKTFPQVSTIDKVYPRKTPGFFIWKSLPHVFPWRAFWPHNNRDAANLNGESDSVFDHPHMWLINKSTKNKIPHKNYKEL